MPVTERLTIALPAPLAEQLRRSVEAGEYASTSEAVHDALLLWEERRTLRTQDSQGLRQAWRDGVESGDAGPFDVEELKAEARRRFESSAKRA